MFSSGEVSPRIPPLNWMSVASPRIDLKTMVRVPFVALVNPNPISIAIISMSDSFWLIKIDGRVQRQSPRHTGGKDTTPV